MDKISKIAYVLITPARDEERYIAKTLDSVISQTVLPKKWVIVSDSSTDRTDEIVNKYAANHEYVQLLCVSCQENRNFGSKVNAFGAGVRHLNGLEYDFIGNLDADVSFGPNYFERLLQKFLQNPRLGIGGGKVLELQNGEYKERPGDRPWIVAGAVLLFRRQCYEEVGGFIPLKAGGEDTAAQIMARMNGWEVKSFIELKVLHHRPTGTGAGDVWSTRFHQGIQDYMLGQHIAYFMVKCLGRVLEKPFLFGSVLRVFGYCWSGLTRKEKPVSTDFIRFHRHEQINRLKSLLKVRRNPVRWSKPH